MKEYHVLNLGAGVQSTCLYLLSREPDSLFHFDAAIFADTGEEPRAVYEHLSRLQEINDPKIIIRSVGDRLGNDLIHGFKNNGKWSTSIPAFTAVDHLRWATPCDNALPPIPRKVGLISRQCTNKYKIKVVVMSIKHDVLGLKQKKCSGACPNRSERVPKDIKVYQYFGITTDEASRAKKSFPETPWSTPKYPFLEMGWSRQDCINWLKEKWQYPVPRSACVFCPYRSNSEWLQIKNNDPEGWQRALEIDKGIRDEKSPITNGLNDKLYLHRSCVPLDLVDFEHSNTLFRPMTNECQGMCGV